MENENESLLKKSSLDLKKERKIETVDIKEIYNILYKFNKNDNPDFSMEEIYSQIGLSPRSYRHDKQKGHSRKITKYALLGLLNEQQESQQEKIHKFTFDELVLIFSALLSLSALIPIETENIKKLQRTIAILIS